MGWIKRWDDGTTNDDANTRAGILYAGAIGANLNDGSVEGDWRLPTKTELVGLVNGTPELRCTSEPCNLYGFSGIQSSYYWSSSTYVGDAGYAWDVGLDTGYVTSVDKSHTYYVWPVRSDN